MEKLELDNPIQVFYVNMAVAVSHGMVVNPFKSKEGFDTTYF